MNKLFLSVILLCATVIAVQATPMIEADVTDGDAPLTVHFSCYHPNMENATSITWFIENGAVYHEQNFNHTFTEPGRYSVMLVFNHTHRKGKITTETNTKTAFIRVGDGYKNKYLTTDQMREHGNNVVWPTDSGLNVAATVPPASIPKTQSVLKTAKITVTETETPTKSITPTEEPTVNPTVLPTEEETYDAKAEIEALKQQNKELQEQITEQETLLNKIWKWVSVLMGAPQTPE